jgi:DNA gyrase inhibitor GyrI
MDVTIKDQPALRVAGVRHIGPYHQIGRAFARVGSIASGHIDSGSRMIGIFHDDPESTPADRLRSDAAITLPGNTPSPDGLIEQRLPAGRYASVLHQGGYEGLPGVWAALKKEWLPASGHRMGSPSYELYLNDPASTPKAELLTEIYLRLA